MCDFNVNCGVCRKAPQLPNILPCKHVFCEECLRDFVVGRGFDRYGYFPCPECNLGVIVPIGGLHQFYPKVDREAQSDRPSPNPNGFTSDKKLDSKLSIKDPVGLACTSNNLIAVSDRENNKVLLYTTDRELIACFSCNGQINSLTVSDKNTLLVTNSVPSQPLVLEFNQTGERCGVKNTLNKMESSDGVAILRNPNRIVVSSVETSSLYILDESGRLLNKISGKSLLGHPHHLATNWFNDIIVSDRLNHVVKIMNLKGIVKATMGGIGTEEEHLYEPMGICVDKQNNVIVSDSGNRCVKCFTKTGKFARVLAVCTDIQSKPINVALTKTEEYLVILIACETPHFEVLSYIPPTEAKSHKSCIPLLR